MKLSGIQKNINQIKNNEQESKIELGKDHYETINKKMQEVIDHNGLTEFSLKELVCIAAHLSEYIYDCKNERISNFSKPCINCMFNQSCDFNTWPLFRKISKATNVNISPLTQRDK